MSRLFWIAFGASAGVMAARRLRQVTAQLTPETLAGKALDRGREFWGDVRRYSADREAELRDAMGLNDPPA